MLLKKKVFFVISSLRTGGSERVFWLLSQGFNKEKYEVTIVLMDSKRFGFPVELENVRIIDLKTVKASLSFFKLYNLLKNEKPYAVFSTGGHIDTLVSFTSLFFNIPYVIARPTNVAEKRKFSTRKAKLLSRVIIRFYQNFDVIICQSAEIKNSFINNYKVAQQKLVIIPNPAIPTKNLRVVEPQNNIKRIIVVARLTKQKGLLRLLEVFKNLPPNYCLTIAGDGPLRDEMSTKIDELNLKERVQTLGTITDVTTVISKHNLFVLPSFIEGFPNVVIESLSVGTPVVSFEVGGITEIIINDFNGYIVEQGNLKSFQDQIIKACNKTWDSIAIEKDVINRFGIEKVVARYESLITDADSGLDLE